jgi:hypothetical protein
MHVFVCEKREKHKRSFRLEIMSSLIGDYHDEKMEEKEVEEDINYQELYWAQQPIQPIQPSEPEEFLNYTTDQLEEWWGNADPISGIFY